MRCVGLLFSISQGMCLPGRGGKPWLLTVLLSCCLIDSTAQAQEKPLFDQLVLTHGGRLEGLVTEETAHQVRFQFLIRKPGLPTLVFEATYERSEIASISKATEPGRAAARLMIQNLENSRRQEEIRVNALELQSAPWITGTGKAHRYQGPYFELLSNARESLVRLVAVRLESIFAAYVKTLGQRQRPSKPVQIVLYHSIDEYRQGLQLKGIPFLNPAVYDARTNQMLVGCDLELQESQLQALNRKHLEQLKELAEQKKKIEQHYPDKPPATLVKQLQQLHVQLLNLNAENEATYARLQTAFFAILYHEAFHAYLDLWVFPVDRYQVPRWLNEGLAQLFENAFVEIDELRIGRIDEKRLADIQDAVRKGRFMTIREILQAPAQQFFVRHTQERFEADRQYNASWALAHFLAYDRNLLGSKEFISYVSLPYSGNEITRFEKLVGLPMDECETRWREYLLRLRTDGSLRPLAGK